MIGSSAKPQSRALPNNRNRIIRKFMIDTDARRRTRMRRRFNGLIVAFLPFVFLGSSAALAHGEGTKPAGRFGRVQQAGYRRNQARRTVIQRLGA
jgi:hypothetical protein